MDNTVEHQVGTVGLGIAMMLYGAQCAADPGTWVTLATVRIPIEDEAVFLELVHEKMRSSDPASSALQDLMDLPTEWEQLL